jgi:hypothetical protein
MLRRSKGAQNGVAVQTSPPITTALQLAHSSENIVALGPAIASVGVSTAQLWQSDAVREPSTASSPAMIT